MVVTPVLIINLSIEGHVAVSYNDIFAKKREYIRDLSNRRRALDILSLSVSCQIFFFEFISSKFLYELNIMHVYDL